MTILRKFFNCVDENLSEAKSSDSDNETGDN
jgi:hypothetical protein